MAARKLTVFLTGGTGFVGGHLARRLAERGHRVRALVRSPALARELDEFAAELVSGDVTREDTLVEVASGCQVVVHLVGIIREKPPALTFESVHTRGTQNVVRMAKRSGVAKFVHMSALGAKPEGTAYQRTKYEAEEVVRRSGLPYLIYRPSIIVGPDSEFIRLLSRMIRYAPVAPVIGDGQYRLQPVDVDDVATAFIQGVERDELENSSFDIGGPHKLTYNRILEVICEELDVRRGKLHLPVGLVRPFVELASNWRLPTPVSSEELAMLLEESVLPGESNALREVFDVEPRSLRSVLQSYAAAKAAEE